MLSIADAGPAGENTVLWTKRRSRTSTERPLRVLLIEDNPADARLVLEGLTDAASTQPIRSTFDLAAVGFLEDGLRHLAAGGVDAVLLDLGLPDGDGLDALLRVRLRAPTVPVVVLTGRRDPEIASEVLRYGALDYLVKGQDEGSVLARSLRYAAESRRLADERFRAARQQLARDRARRLARHEREQAERLHGLAEAALALNTILVPDAILDVLAKRARALIGAHVAIASLDGDDHVPAISAIASSAWHIRRRAAGAATGLPSLASLARTSGAGLGTVRLDQSELRSLVSDGVRLAGEAGATSGADGADAVDALDVPRGWLAAPLLGTDGRRIGLVQLWDKPSSRRRGRQDFTSEDEAILAQLAHMASVAAENARLFREAQDAVQGRDDFLATVTHDLRNPLASIRGYAQLLLRQERRAPTPRSQAVHALETIQATTTRMERLVDELLDVARVRAGQPLALRRVRSDLVALARACVEAHQGTTDRHTLRLEADVDTLTGDWDAARLERALDNLLANAIKYSPDGGEITVTVALEQGSEIAAGGDRDGNTDVAVVRVRDQGLGIHAGDLPRIFERFTRGRNVVGRLPGVGIGLAGVRQIVEQHGGTVEAESRENAGSTFSVRLPLGDGVTLAAPQTGMPVLAPSYSIAASSPDSALPAPHRGRVLIVEDDALTQTVLREALLDEGYEVLVAADGERALHILGETAPDVILLDLRMPVMDGHAFARRYQAATQEPAPIIVVTASGKGALNSRPLAAAAVVSKPFVVDELLELVEKHTTERPT